MKKLRIESPNAKFCMYQWDSVKNNENALDIAKYFDKIATFDINDAEKYGWIYRPLFFCYDTERSCIRKYNITFVCSLHSQRLKVYNYLKSRFKNECAFYYIYSKRSHYVKQKYLMRNKEFLGVNDIEINHKSLSLLNVNEIFSQSDIVVDYTHPEQTGFTMRTIESIGHRCKLITNNQYIKKSNFYNPNNIYVYDINNINVPDSFFESGYEELPKHVYDYYSINTWIKELLDVE